MLVLRITVLILMLVVVSSLAWASLFYFRMSKAPDRRKLWYKFSIYSCIAIHCVAIVASPTPVVWSVVVGLVLSLLILILCWSAVWAHRRERPAYAFVKTAPTNLVRSSAYRFVRHPFYLSFLVATLAGTLMSGQFALLLTTVWLGAFYRVAVREEEARFLESDMAEEYVEYQATTGMFLPRLRLRNKQPPVL